MISYLEIVNMIGSNSIFLVSFSVMQVFLSPTPLIWSATAILDEISSLESVNTVVVAPY